MLNTVVHFYGDLFPSLEAEKPQFQKRLTFGISHRFDGCDHFPLQIDKSIDVSVDLVFQINDFPDKPLCFPR